jgi:hypothetical protein
MAVNELVLECSDSQCISSDIYAKGLCKFHYQRSWALQNINNIKERTIKWRLENKDILTEKAHIKYASNKEILSKKSKEYYIKNANNIIKRTADYYNDNKNTIIPKSVEYAKTPERRYLKYIQSAKKRNLFFDISYEDFVLITNNVCTYCNELSPNCRHVGIDRVDNSIGYIKDNIIPCCSVCNRMKSQLSVEDFLSKVFMIMGAIKHE